MPKKPNITREHERELGRLAHAGDNDARNELVMAHYPFVIWIAGRYTNRGADTEDLIQNGLIGLMEAIEKFDPERPTRLLTMAFWMVRRRIIEAIKNGSIYSNNKLNRAARIVSCSLDVPAPEDVREPKRRHVVSLEQLVDHEEQQTLGATIRDENAQDPYKVAADAEMVDVIECGLKLLKKRTRKIIEMRIGRKKRPGMSFTAIAKDYNLSPERIRRIYIKAIEKILQHAGEIE